MSSKISTLSRPVLALLPPLAAFLLQSLFWDYLRPYVWFLFYPAIFFSSWLGGKLGGMLATLLSIALVWYFFIPPEGSFAVEDPRSLLSAAVFMGMGVLFSVFHERLRNMTLQATEALASVQSANDQLEARVDERTGELAHANESMAASEARIAAIVNSAMDAIISVDVEQKIVLFNAAAEQMFRCPIAKALGEPIDRFIPHRFRERHALHIDSFGKSGVTSRSMRSLDALYGLRADGEEFPIEASISQTEVAGQKCFTAILRDITERKQAEEALRTSEEQVRTMIGSVKDYAIILLDPEGRVMTWNSGAESIKGYTANEIVGQHFSRFYATEDIERGKPEHELGVAIAEGRFEDEGWRVRKDGSRFWANVLFSVLKDDSGKLHGFVKVTRDISERKQAEEEIRALNAALDIKVRERTAQLEEANKELESFSYSVSHDLRAPLRHIHGYVEMLTRATEGQLSEKALKYLGTIANASDEMGQLIDDLLAFSRMGQIELHESRVSLDSLVQETIRGLKTETQGRNVIWKIAQLPQVMGDPSMLRQVLANLMGNAVKYTRQRDPAEIEIGFTGEEDGCIILFVRDNGAGFDMQYAHKLFGVFQRLHRADEFEGTGIGLAIVHRIVGRHGGRTWAEGAVNQGATFYFTLKLAPTA